MTAQDKTPTHDAVVLAAGPNGLGVIRGLWLRGVRSIAIALTPDDPVRYSRLPIATFALSAQDSGSRQDELALLLATLPLQRPAVLIPTSDWSVSFLVQNEPVLRQRFSFVTPSRELAEILIDKAAETSLVRSLGLPLPRTISPLPKSAEALVTQGLPLIIKPRSFRHYSLGSKNLVLRTPSQVEEFYLRFGATLSDYLAQEVIPGKDDSLWVCNCTFGPGGSLLSAFTFRRLRLSPSHFGVTSYAVSKRNPQIVDFVSRLGRALSYVGPAMVEFKYDDRDGVPKYIELNPRLGMCNFLDTTCGVPSAYLTYLLALGQEPTSFTVAQRDDVMYLSFFDDLYSRLRDGEAPWEIARHYLGHAFRTHVFAFTWWRDPSPGLHVACSHIRRKVKVWSQPGPDPNDTPPQ